MNEHDIAWHRRIANFASSLPSEVRGRGEIDPPVKTYSDDIIPFDLYRGTRQNIESVADQINASFAFCLYDGCAVLMRRLLEMLLILAFKANHIESDIRTSDGNYQDLSLIIKKAVQSSVLDLSRNAKEGLNLYRERGNLSAHNPFYKARKKDLELAQHSFRSLVEELLYKAGII